MAYIEDDRMRFTVLSGQPSGVACLQSGSLFHFLFYFIIIDEQFYLGVVDIFLDRHLTRDDNRGLGQGVTDNREILNKYKLLFEPIHSVSNYEK